MTITNASSGTNVHEIAAGIYRINTATDKVPGGFSFNQYLIHRMQMMGHGCVSACGSTSPTDA